MSYATIFTCANDSGLIGRVTAACAQEGAASPQSREAEVIWFVSSRSDIEAAYASALAAGNPNAGLDPAVITDQMILSAVQAAPPSSLPS